MKTLRLFLWVLALAGGLALPGLAYDSATPQAPVPPHLAPWLEVRAPDAQTILLWKFSTAADQVRDLGALLDDGDLGALAGDVAEPLAGLAAVDRQANLPKLSGGAREVAGTGRFGGGLELDGTGLATAAVALGELVATDGAFTLDAWFRTQPMPVPTLQALLGFPDARNQPLAAIVLTPERRLILSVAGQERLAIPLAGGPGQWHHLALIVRGPQDRPSLTLAADGQAATVAQPEWLPGMLGRLGRTFEVGGAGGLPGLRGVVDEVRLSRRVRHFYPWRLGEQEFRRPAEALELRPPFFKSGQVLTRFRFDGELKPEAFAGLSWAGRSEAAVFQPGVQGQALDLTRIGEAGFEIAGHDVLPERNGTIEFWFRPLDWHNFYVGDYAGADIGYQWLLAFRAPGEADYQASKNLEVVKGRSWQIANQRRADGSSAVPWTPIHPGAWTHVLIVLADNGAQTVYLDGRQQKFHQLGLVLRGAAIEAWREKTGGEAAKDPRRWSFVPSSTLVDELSVFGWPMNAEEAWNAYARWLPDAAAQMQPLPLFKVEFDYFAHSWDMQEKLEIRVSCLPVGDVKPASVDCELMVAGASSSGADANAPAGAGMLPPTLLSVQRQPLDAAGAATFTLAQTLPFGRYPVLVRSRAANGQVLAEEGFEYVRERPAWLDNTLGKERTVPAPWTPIVVAGRRLSIVGRQIELGDNGLPAAIETLGRPLLAGPATVRVDGQELRGQGVKFAESATDRVAWTATLGGAGGMVAELDAWLEFDGLIYCAVTLKPAAGTAVTVADLDIDFPLMPAAATQLLANGGGGDFRNSWIAKYVPTLPEKGRSANENGDENGGRSEPPRDPLSSPLSSTDSVSLQQVWNSLEQPYPSFCRAFEVTNFMPHLWLGNDQVGLYFGAENDQGWTVDGPLPAQEILRVDGAVVCRLNILREPTRIEAAGRRFHFVLLPTPAKPEPPDWRQQMLAGGVNFGACDSFGGFEMKTDPSDPLPGDTFRLEPRSWEHAAAMAAQGRAKWGRCILYADASWPQLGPAFRDWRHHMWADTGRLAWTPEFEDYAVWAINEFLVRGLIDGVYWDDVSVGSTLLLRGGAYEYAGSAKGRRVGFTMLAQRRVNLRLWRLFEAAGKEPCIWAHMTVCYEVPLFSFCRYLSNVEFTTGVDFPGQRDAMDVWSPDTLRLLGGSAKWGTGFHNLSTLPRTLPDTAVARQWAYPQQRSETGLYLTSDQMGPADGLGQVLVREKVFDRPVRAYPWWQADQIVAVTAPEGATVRAGVYVADGRAVVVVANWDREEREVEITLRPEALPGAAGGVAWRDLDPGLEPPAAVAASAEELKQVQAGAANADLLGNDGGAVDDVALGDLLEGTTPTSRARKRLELRVEDNQARVVVRPRDYRVLEARPQR